MSRSVKCNGRGFYRRPRTQNSRVMEQRARDEIVGSDYHIPNRLRTRANLHGAIPTAYDDLYFSTRIKYQTSSP